MRKMVVHFGPDTEGGGTQKHDRRDTDPARRRYTEQSKPADKEPSWMSLLPRTIANRIRRLERIIDSIDAADVGRFIVRKIKDMPRRRKVLIGVVAVAGAAGATYLAARRRK